MENEENRGLINKKAFEDQLERFFTKLLINAILELSLFSLSYSWILRVFLEHSWAVWNTWIFGEKGKLRVGKHKRTSRSKTTMSFSCKYQVACMISLLVLACMTYTCDFLVMTSHWHGGFPGLIVVFHSLFIY